MKFKNIDNGKVETFESKFPFSLESWHTRMLAAEEQWHLWMKKR